MRVPSWIGHQRSTPVLTAWAVALVAAATVLVFSGAGPAWLPHATAAPGGGSTTTVSLLEPLPEDELPPPGGEPATDEAMARCATAVVRDGRAAEYPPTAGWRATQHVGTGAPQSELTIDNAFACLITPGKVTVSGTSGTPVGGVQVVRMSPDELVVLNPEGRRFTIGTGDKREVDTNRVAFVGIDGRAPIGDVRLTVGRYDGPVPEPVEALTVIDRALPERTYSADGAQLADCLSRLPPSAGPDPELWVPVGRHDIGDGTPAALVARISGVSVGYCVFDPGDGPTFSGAPLEPTGDRAQPLDFYRGAATTLLLSAPPDVTRMEVAAQAAPAERHPCTLVDGLAMCTLNASGPPADPGSHAIVVTAFTTADPQGSEVYRN
jgi:hypothetical protein